MLPPDSGFFAMWNGIAPEHARSFALMHTRDHLAEHVAYLGEDGFSWARRFCAGLGSLPPNFAWYAIPSLSRLRGSAASAARVHETALFKALRPHYRDRIAHHCQVLASAGGGTGSAAATILVTLTEAACKSRSLAQSAVDAMTQMDAVTAAHLSVVDWTVPVRAGGALPSQGPDDARLGVLLIEGFERFDLAASVEPVMDLVRRSNVVDAIHRHGHYALSYALERAEVDELRCFRQDDALAAKLLRAINSQSI